MHLLNTGHCEDGVQFHGAKAKVASFDSPLPKWDARRATMNYTVPELNEEGTSRGRQEAQNTVTKTKELPINSCNISEMKGGVMVFQFGNAFLTCWRNLLFTPLTMRVPPFPPLPCSSSFHIFTPHPTLSLCLMRTRSDCGCGGDNILLC